MKQVLVDNDNHRFPLISPLNITFVSKFLVMSDNEELSMLPRNNKVYAKKEYWEERFATEESFEWLVSYDDIALQLEKYLPTNKSDPM